MNDVIFNRGEGGLGRALAGEDHVSGLLAYLVTADLPASFNTDKIKVIYSIEEAEALGITNLTASPDAVKALHYQINCIFEANKQAVLYLAIYDRVGTTAPDYTKVLDVQRFAEGKVRQLGVLNEEVDFAGSIVTSLQAQADILEAGLARLGREKRFCRYWFRRRWTWFRNKRFNFRLNDWIFVACESERKYWLGRSL